jgi:translation initiation factor IF-1
VERRGHRHEGGEVEFEGEAVEALRSGMFRILLEHGHEMLGYTGGKMKRHRIGFSPSDRVKVELSPYDLTRGRIVLRFR